MDLANIDYKALKEQKAILINMIQDWGEADDEQQKKDAEKAEGLIHLIDAIQDYAVDVLRKDENEVFNLESEDDKYLLKENSIHILGSHSVNINEKIFSDELFEYRIIERKDFIDELIRWISETKSESDKYLMKEDLEMLMNVTDDYIFSSISTNEYITKDDGNFNEICEELLKLNENLK
jgi:hypothetical protein